MQRNRTRQYPRRGPLYWFRWLLVLPAVGVASVLAGIAGVLPCLLFDFEQGLFLVGRLCAIAWVAAAYLTAPSHKTRTAAVAYIAGVVSAWFLTAKDPIQGGSMRLAFTLACAGGVAALFLCQSAKTRRRWLNWARSAFSARSISDTASTIQQLITKGEEAMKQNRFTGQIMKRYRLGRLLAASAALVAAGCVVVAIGRAAIDIVPQERRGLHMRLGKYVQTLDPGLHLKIPIIDTIIGVSVKERQGYIKHVDAMTEDNVIMKVSLQYTYEVIDPMRYRLEVEDPDTIIREFVQGKLRDIVNTISMSDVMKKRMEFGQRIMEALAGREHDYGIHFKLIQVQGTYPPHEVQEAIKQRMVTEQHTVGAREEATQKQIIADAALYEARKQSEAAKYQIEETAKARKESIRMLLDELSKHADLGPKYLEYLISQELRHNSKWIISGSHVPQIHLADGGTDPAELP